MSAASMLRLAQGFSGLKFHATPWNILKRKSSKNVIDKLELPNKSKNFNILEKLGLPEKPKRPMPSFFLYRLSIEAELKKAQPNLSQTEISKLASKRWKECSEEEKKKFTEEYLKSYEKYKVKLEEYDSKITPEQKAEIREAEADFKILKERRLLKLMKEQREKELKKPKPPLSPFFRFLLEEKRPSEKEGNKNFTKHMAEKWKNLSEQKRKAYSDEYAELKEDFQKKLLEWEEKMIKLGNVDVIRNKTLKEKLKNYS